MSRHTNGFQLRNASIADEEQIAEICLQTANSGQDATRLYSRPDLPALVWATPYLYFDPSYCFVIEKDKKLLGYIVAASDTVRFKVWQRENWWPQVAARLQGFEPTTEHDQLGLSAIENEKQAAPEFATQYPAHLHINLLAGAQGTGLGRKLIEVLCDKLVEAGVVGVHLGVSTKNTNALGFYRALGFSKIAEDGAIFLGKAFS